MADEPVFGPDQADAVMRRGLRLLCVKLMKSGGLATAARVCDLAQQYGARVMIGCMDELPISMEDAIRARLARLDGLERATVERAAVVGEVFWDGAVLGQMRGDRTPPGDGADPLSIWPDDENDPGGWKDHKTGEYGSVADLAKQLGIDPRVSAGSGQHQIR